MNTIHMTPAHAAAQTIKEKMPPSFQPKVGIVLGSGLSNFVDQMDVVATFPYAELPGFPSITVHGHGKNLVLGYLFGVGVACLQGRAHSYEGDHFDSVKTYVRTLQLLGCEYFLATNAAGSLREDVGPGELMLITDHINMQPGNPLVGPNDDAFGPRFFPMDDAYNLDLRERFQRLAQAENITLHEGIYLSVLGPNYETAAEIRAFRILGADVLGMSTVPEVLVAHHCGLKIAVISVVTNYATGLASTQHSHEAVVTKAMQASEKLNVLVNAVIKDLA